MKKLFVSSIFVLALIGTIGCSSIHSKAVRSLISIESEKLTDANQAASKLVMNTQSRIDAMRASLDSLETSMQQQNTAELVHALVFSANQNIETKKGSDAHAVSYMIGKLYLDKQAGLQMEVRNQSLADIAALEQQGKLIQKSWKDLAELHKKVQEFADKSAFAAIDPDLIKAVAGEIPGASSEIDTVLEDSKKVNRALDTVLNLPVANSSALHSAQSELSDFIDLLERVKANPKAGTP
jgi:hypothetical protein